MIPVIHVSGAEFEEDVGTIIVVPLRMSYLFFLGGGGEWIFILPDHY